MAKRRKSELADAVGKMFKDGAKGATDDIVITPSGILLVALDDAVKAGLSGKTFAEFQRFLLGQLSSLATNGEKDDLFGSDFDDFFSMVVRTLNLCGRMRAALEENGIDFDFREGGKDDDHRD